MLIDLVTPERTHEREAMFAYYDKIIKQSSQTARRALISGFGVTVWEEDYDAWKERIKGLDGRDV